MKCARCGFQIEHNEAFCGQCGAKAEPNQKNETQHRCLLLILAGGLCVIIGLVLLFVTLFQRLFSTGGEKFLYMKDFTIIEYQIKSQSSQEISTKGPGLNIYGQDWILQYSENERYLYYLENMDSDTGTLYYKDLQKQSDKMDTAQKVDANVSYFEVLESGTVFYLKGDSLYFYDLKEKTKIASNVLEFYVDADERNIIWLNWDSVLYHMELGKSMEKQKLVSGVEDTLLYISDDLKNIYYESDDVLYHLHNLENKKKLVVDFEDYYVMDTGSVYYLKHDRSIDFSEFIIDDLIEQDQRMKKPERADFRSYNMITGNDYYDSEAFQEAQAAYEGKLNRDWLRGDLAAAEIDLYSMYFYDGQEERLIADNVITANRNYSQSKEKILAITYIDFSEFEPILFSAYWNRQDYYEDVMESFLKAGAVAAGQWYGTLSEEIYYAYYDEAGGQIYYTCWGDDIVYAADKVEPGSEARVTSLYDEASLVMYANSGLVYYYGADINNSLYCNGDFINDNVYTTTWSDETCYYITDMNSKNASGDLYIYADGKSTLISEDVFSYRPLEDGSVLVLTDFSEKRLKGDLYCWQNNNTKVLIDEDVSYLHLGVCRGEYIINR